MFSVVEAPCCPPLVKDLRTVNVSAKIDTYSIKDSHGTYTLENICKSDFVYCYIRRIILFFTKCSCGFMSNHPKMPQKF